MKMTFKDYDPGDNYDGWDTDLLSDYVKQAFPEGLDDVKPEKEPADESVDA